MISRRQAHRHPDLADNCAHDPDGWEAATHWPDWLIVAVSAAGIVLAFYLALWVIWALGELVA